MKKIYRKGLFAIAAIAVAATASAQQYQIGTFSHGTFTYSPWQDSESVDFFYFNGHAPIALTTFFLDPNSASGFLAGPGNVDVLNFRFAVDNSQTLGSAVNQEANWQVTSGTGAFAGTTGLGSFSIDLHFTDGNTAQSATGLTGELTPVPEPASIAALGIGAVAMLRRRRRA